MTHSIQLILLVGGWNLVFVSWSILSEFEIEAKPVECVTESVYEVVDSI